MDNYVLLLQSKKERQGTSLAVQWLRRHASTAGSHVQPLIRELRSHMLCNQNSNKKNQRREYMTTCSAALVEGMMKGSSLQTKHLGHRKGLEVPIVLPSLPDGLGNNQEPAVSNQTQKLAQRSPRAPKEAGISSAR